MNIVPMFVDLMAVENLKGFEYLHPKLYDAVKQEKAKGSEPATWHCDTYNTLYSDYKFMENEDFRPLFREIENKVLTYSREFGIEHDTVCSRDGWINLAGPGAYQEYHIHPGSHFSTVYYAKVPEGCNSKLVFQSSKYYVDMYSLPVRNYTPANFGTFIYEPKEGDLVIFRSHIPHMVTKNQSDQDRVSISINYYFMELDK